MSKSGIMRWNCFSNFEATYLATLGARELILGAAIEVGVHGYLQTGNESRAIGGHGVTCDQTPSGKIGLIFGKL